MENFISTIIFILPGFMMYFWIQSFGINPVVKHTSTEMVAIATFLWIPVSIVTLGLYNLIGLIYNVTPIWTLESLKDESTKIIFMSVFLMLSAGTSFIISYVYVKKVHPWQQKKINKVRESRGIAPFSDKPTVWDEIFGSNEAQVVNISKVDQSEVCVIGDLYKVSRPFEPDKSVCLNDVDYFTELVHEYEVPVSQAYIDVKSGICIKIYDSASIQEACKKKDSVTTSAE